MTAKGESTICQACTEPGLSGLRTEHKAACRSRGFPSLLRLAVASAMRTGTSQLSRAARERPLPPRRLRAQRIYFGAMAAVRTRARKRAPNERAVGVDTAPHAGGQRLP